MTINTDALFVIANGMETYAWWNRITAKEIRDKANEIDILNKRFQKSQDELERAQLEIADLNKRLSAVMQESDLMRFEAVRYMRERNEARLWARKFYRLYNEAINMDDMSRAELLRDEIERRCRERMING